VELDPVLLGEGHVGQHVMPGLVHAGAKLRPAGAQLVGNLPPDLCRSGMIGLEEDLADGSGNDSVLPLGNLASALRVTCTRQRCQVALTSLIHDGLEVERSALVLTRAA
jgi:hypothetical protein